MTEIPPPIHSRVVDAIGSIRLVIDRSWSRDNSNVWELTTMIGQRFFLKCHPTPRFHYREVTAYRRWTAHLGYGRAPSLVAADATLRYAVVTALPGRPLSEQRTSTAVASRIHEQAGTLLRRLHDADSPVRDTTNVARVASRAEKHLRRSAGLLQPHHAHLIRSQAARLLELVAQLPAVPTHGDAQPKNFLWDAGSEHLALIDFERAELAPAVRDLVRLENGPWAGHPELKAAFFRGYARQLTTVEKAALCAYITLDAASRVQWGMANNDNNAVRRSIRTLNHLSQK